MPIPKAVLYTRVSTTIQAEQGTGLEVQETACLRKAQELGAEVMDIISDEGVSGAFYLSRPGIQKALAMLEAKQADTLITMKLDRSGRDADVLAVIRKRVQNAGAKLVFVDGANFENNATGNLLFRVNAGFVEYEREVIRERTTSGRRKRAESGIQPCRTLSPYGYHVVTKGDVLTGGYASGTLGTYRIVEEQAVWVREIFRRYAAGISTRKIKYWLESERVGSPNNCPEWSPTTLTRILANPVYKGTPVFGRTMRKVDEARIGEGHKRTDFSVARKEEQWVYLDCEPLVSTEVWQNCQERLQKNKQIYSGQPKRKYLLSGMMVCPICKKRPAGTRCGKVRYYACPYDRKCSFRSNADRAETAVNMAIDAIVHHPNLTETAIQAYNVHHQNTDDTALLERLVSELDKLGQQEKATARAQVEAIIQGRSTEVYDTLLSEIGAKRNAIRAQLAIVEATSEQIRTLEPKSESDKAARMIAIVEEVLADSLVTAAEKNRLLSKIVQAIHPQQEDPNEFEVFLQAIPGTSDTVAQILIRVTFDIGDFLSVQAVEVNGFATGNFS